MGCCFSCCYETKKKDYRPNSNGYQSIDSKIYKETEIINTKSTKSPQYDTKRSPVQAPVQRKTSPPLKQQSTIQKPKPNLSPVRVQTWKDVSEKKKPYQSEDNDKLEEETNLYFSAMETPLVRKRATSSENIFNLNASLKRLRHNNKTSLFEINTISQKIAYRGPIVTKTKSPVKFAANNTHEVNIDLNGLNIKDAIQVVNSSMSFYSNRKINKLDHLTKKVIITYTLERDPVDIATLASPMNNNLVSNRNVMPKTEHKNVTTPPPPPPPTSSDGRSSSNSLRRSVSNSTLSTVSTSGRLGTNSANSNPAAIGNSEYRHLGYQLFDYLVDKGVEECELVNSGLLKVGVIPKNR